MATPPELRSAAEAEIERRSRVMAEAMQLSPYGRPERDEGPGPEPGAMVENGDPATE